MPNEYNMVSVSRYESPKSRTELDWNNFGIGTWPREIAVLLLIFTIFYFGQLANFSLSIDDEFAAFRNNSEVWLSQGRWSIYLFEHFVMPQPIVPFLPTFLFGLLCATGYTVLARTFDIQKSKFLYYALFPIIVAYPTWYLLIEFASNTPAAGLGFFFSCASTYYFKSLSETIYERNTIPLDSQFVRMCIACVLLSAAAIGSYQSFLFVQLALGCGVIIFQILRQEENNNYIRAIILLGILAATGLTAYFLIWKTLLVSLNVNTSSYVSGFINVKLLFSEPLSIMLRLARQAWRVYTGSSHIYGIASPALLLPLLLGVFGLTTQLRLWRKPPQKLNVRTRATFTLLVGIIIILPFGLNPLSSGILPTRALVGIPFSMWLLCLIGFATAPRLGARIALFILPILFFQFIYINVNMQAGRSLARTHDRLLAVQIYDRIAQRVPSFNLKDKYKIDFFGSKTFHTPYPKPWSGAGSHSFFEWDLGNPYRIGTYMKLIGLDNLSVVGVDQRRDFLPRFKKMPSWPAEGSIQMIENVILVKLSDKPGLIHSNFAKQ